MANNSDAEKDNGHNIPTEHRNVQSNGHHAVPQVSNYRPQNDYNAEWEAYAEAQRKNPLHPFVRLVRPGALMSSIVPPIGSAGPPTSSVFPPIGRAGAPISTTAPPIARAGAPMVSVFPPMGSAGAKMVSVFPPMGSAGAPMGSAVPQMYYHYSGAQNYTEALLTYCIARANNIGVPVNTADVQKKNCPDAQLDNGSKDACAQKLIELQKTHPSDNVEQQSGERSAPNSPVNKSNGGGGKAGKTRVHRRKKVILVERCTNCFTTHTCHWRGVQGGGGNVICNRCYRFRQRRGMLPPKHCKNCCTTNTSEWRRDKDGRLICNSCRWLKTKEVYTSEWNQPQGFATNLEPKRKEDMGDVARQESGSKTSTNDVMTGSVSPHQLNASGIHIDGTAKAVPVSGFNTRVHHPMAPTKPFVAGGVAALAAASNSVGVASYELAHGMNAPNVAVHGQYGEMMGMGDDDQNMGGSHSPPTSTYTRL